MALNIFLNTYRQPENKLTYNFLCLVDKIDAQKEFSEYLIDRRKKLKKSPVIEIQTVFSGGASNPDGMIVLDTIDGCVINVYLESKTYRYGLTAKQLKNHINVHFNNDNDLLLVITPRISDRDIVRSIGDARIIFKTWNEIANYLAKMRSVSFLIEDFIEYGSITGEFENMSEVLREEIEKYVYIRKNKVEQKFSAVIEKAVHEYFHNNLKYEFGSVSNHWGRQGIEVTILDKNQDYGQWFFFGLYNESNDHKIKLKKQGTPELAFFFDIDPSAAPQLKNDKKIIESFKKLKECGFENNITDIGSTNKWRLLWKRISIDDIDQFNVKFCKEFIHEIISIIESDSYFKRKLL